MSNIEDRDEQTYLNGFEGQPELPYDWDSEEAQGTKEELKAETFKELSNTLYAEELRVESYDISAYYPSVNHLDRTGDQADA